MEGRLANKGVAKACGVSDRFVSELRKPIIERFDDSYEVRPQRHRHQQYDANIGKSEQAVAYAATYSAAGVGREPGVG